MTASSVPTADMASVSSDAISSLRMNSGLPSSCVSSARKRPILRNAPSDRNFAHCRSSDQKLSVINTTTPRTNQQALQRAVKKGGGTGCGGNLPGVKRFAAVLMPATFAARR